MNKRTHRNKVKMARRMRKPIEMSHHTFYLDKDGNPTRATYANIFDSEAWLTRKLRIAERVKRHQAEAHASALARKAQKYANTL